MGYYTEYTLSVQTYPDGGQVPAERLEQLNTMLESLAVFESRDVDVWWGCCKWYDNADDMKVVSKKFPELLFKLHGEGEDSGDMWDHYFLDGKAQLCQVCITYGDFDPAKLEEFETAAEKRWKELEDVSFDPETECLDSPWHQFPTGTHREEIWHWFEDYYHVSVHDLMYGY